MPAVSSPGIVPTFQLADPLDWSQLRALLWECVEDPGMQWGDVPAFLAERCPGSAPVTAVTCQQIYERLANAFSPPGSGAISGPALWSEMLYSSVHALFPQTPIFMNLGYLGEIPGLLLEPEDEPLYPFIALYRCALDGVAIAGRDVVDVGCGAGGGCWHILRYLDPRTVTGVDLVQANITAAKRLFHHDRLQFVCGNAERLPAADESADVVVNIESSHCYRSFPAFLNEVRRVLRPGGIFAFADHRPLKPEWGDRRTMESLTSDLAAFSLEVLRRRNITHHVVASCELLADFKEQMLRDAPLSDLDRRHMREILHCRDSDNHGKLSDAKWSYCCWTIRKPA